MDLNPYLQDIHRQLETAAEAAGDEARAVTERLVAPLEAAIRLALLDVLAAAAEEITVELAPGSVELRLRGRDPEFVVTPTAADTSPEEPAGDAPAWSDTVDADDGATARINLRLPESVKARIEQAASAHGLSVNAWLVRAAAAAADRADSARWRERHSSHGPQRYTGWAR